LGVLRQTFETVILLSAFEAAFEAVFSIASGAAGDYHY
jgi:hypothetical protein